MNQNKYISLNYCQLPVSKCTEYPHPSPPRPGMHLCTILVPKINTLIFFTPAYLQILMTMHYKLPTKRWESVGYHYPCPCHHHSFFTADCG